MDRMTDPEINRRLAKALGWPFISWERFSPATDSNHLREYVLPEVKRRDLWEHFEAELCEATPDEIDGQAALVRYLLTAEPRVLALAALKVLEVNNV